MGSKIRRFSRRSGSARRDPRDTSRTPPAPPGPRFGAQKTDRSSANQTLTCHLLRTYGCNLVFTAGRKPHSCGGRRQNSGNVDLRRHRMSDLVIFGVSNMLGDVFDCALALGHRISCVVLNRTEVLRPRTKGVHERIRQLAYPPRLVDIDSFVPQGAEIYVLGTTHPNRTVLVEDLNPHSPDDKPILSALATIPG